jgi:hypothetical protein
MKETTPFPYTGQRTPLLWKKKGGEMKNEEKAEAEWLY